MAISFSRIVGAEGRLRRFGVPYGTETTIRKRLEGSGPQRKLTSVLNVFLELAQTMLLR